MMKEERLNPPGKDEGGTGISEQTEEANQTADHADQEEFDLE